MTNAQKPNKHLRNKSNKRTTTKGARGRREVIFLHGKGKGGVKTDSKKKRILK